MIYSYIHKQFKIEVWYEIDEELAKKKDGSPSLWSP